MSDSERKAIHLKPAEIPGPEKVTIIYESSESIFVVVQHNSIYGDSPTDTCQGSVAVDIPKAYKGTVKSTCVTCSKEVAVNATHVLLATKRLIINSSCPEKPIPLTAEAIQELSARYRLPSTVLQAWGIALGNDLTRLERYLKSQHSDRISQDQPEEKKVPEQ